MRKTEIAEQYSALLHRKFQEQVHQHEANPQGEPVPGTRQQRELNMHYFIIWQMEGRVARSREARWTNASRAERPHIASEG